MTKPVVLSYSGGKDCTYALHVLKQDPDWQVVRLRTTAARPHRRTSMHGVRIELLNGRRRPSDCPSTSSGWMRPTAGITRAAWRRCSQGTKSGGLSGSPSGISIWRTSGIPGASNASVGMGSLFPLWGIPVRELAKRFIDDGFRAVVVCVDTEQLDVSFCGREYDLSLLKDLPDSVDWCAEKGEFHTFCYDGPRFRSRPISPGRKGAEERAVLLPQPSAGKRVRDGERVRGGEMGRVDSRLMWGSFQMGRGRRRVAV